MAIRDRLREILFNVYEDGYTHGYERKMHRLTIRLSDSFYQKNIDQIIALFKEEGYWHVTSDGFMAGAEFYERFEKELEELVERTNTRADFTEAILAARRASGVK